MKQKFSTWFQDKLDKYKKKKDSPFPRLPDPRPQALTPSPSQEVPPQECLFFARLPYELRRDILILAFGKNRLHMDLSFEHPPAPYAPGQRCERDHAGVHAANGKRGNHAKLNRKKPKAWLWWGSICHRYHRPLDRRDNPGPMSGGWGPTGPWEDYCRYGYAADCNKWPGDTPFKCQIGAMGWLLACRQAYTEGIDVLYETNCLHMSSEVMISHLPELLLPQRLDTMTSLEIIWPLKTRMQENQVPTLEEGHLETLFNLIPSHFHNLSRLYIALQPTARMRILRHWLDAETVLKQFDQLVPQMPGLVECCLALPSSVFLKLVSPLIDKFRKESTVGYTHFFRRAFRFLDGEHVIGELYTDAYPDPPPRSHEANKSKSKIGYWIVQAGNDGEGEDSPPCYCGGWMIGL